MDLSPLQRLRAPEAEVWIRLRPPTLLQAVGRGLEEDIEFSDELVSFARWMLDTNADATWDWTSDDLRKAAEQLVGMVAPVLGDAEEVARRINTWAAEWSFR